MPTRPIPTPTAGAPAVGWPVHVEIQVDGHPDDAVMQAAAAALVAELARFDVAAFGGRGFITLICASPTAELPPDDDRAASLRVIEAALPVVSRFAPVRRIHSVEPVNGEPATAPPPDAVD